MSFDEKMTDLADAIREKTNQTESLSLDEMASSVRSIELGGGTSGGAPITTEYTYEYSGDLENNSLFWVCSNSGVKVFVKAGEIPSGTINYVGSTAYRKHTTNQWLDRTFTITEDILAMTINRGVDINAKQSGMVQIFSKESYDTDYFAAICICTKPGKYNIVFQDWYETTQFDQTGIYFYDNRSYGGKDYLQSFSFSATVNPSAPGGSFVETTPNNYSGNEIQIFTRGICIGDSITDGTFDTSQGNTVIRKHSYPAILKRLTGIDIVNAGISGATSKTWYEAALNSEPQWGKWVNQEWIWNTNLNNGETDVISTTLDFSGFEFAVIHLGINDLAEVFTGTTSIEQVLSNYKTYINNIITKLKEANNGIKVFLATIIPSYAKPGDATYEQLNNKIKEIVEELENVYLLDLNEYSEMATVPAYNNGHPTALGYQKIASEICSLISYIIKNNLNDFNSV